MGAVPLGLHPNMLPVCGLNLCSDAPFNLPDMASKSELTREVPAQLHYSL